MKAGKSGELVCSGVMSSGGLLLTFLLELSPAPAGHGLCQIRALEVSTAPCVFWHV